MEPNAFQALVGMGPIGMLAIVVWILLKREERDRQDRLLSEEKSREIAKIQCDAQVALATAFSSFTYSHQDLTRRIEEWCRRERPGTSEEKGQLQ